MNYVYLLRCADGTLYCGWTTDLAARVKTHNSGKGAKYTRSRLPAELVYYETYEDRHEALRREWQLKRLPRAEKLALIRNAEKFRKGEKYEASGKMSSVYRESSN
jgi:putative endonuclease